MRLTDSSSATTTVGLVCSGCASSCACGSLAAPSACWAMSSSSSSVSTSCSCSCSLCSSVIAASFALSNRLDHANRRFHRSITMMAGALPCACAPPHPSWTCRCMRAHRVWHSAANLGANHCIKWSPCSIAHTMVRHAWHQCHGKLGFSPDARRPPCDSARSTHAGWR